MSKINNRSRASINSNPARDYKNTSKLQRFLEHIWYERGKAKWLLLPLTLIYCSVNAFQRWRLSRHQIKQHLPIIVVGNISVGGTGKTPIVLYIAELLLKAGYKPGFITRGYGGQSPIWPLVVTSDSDPVEVGDEALLLASRTGLPVVAGPDRIQDINKLQAMSDCDVVISDDGLQHYRLHRDIEIVVVDGQRQMGNGWCIPAGPLREPVSRLSTVDFVLVNQSSQLDLNELTSFSKRFGLTDNCFVTTIIPAGLKSLEANQVEIKLSDFHGKTVHAVTGIGNPQKFYDVLEQSEIQLIKHSFPDHHGFSREELCFDDSHAVIMTEKDAVKCRQFKLENCWYLTINAQVVNKDFAQQLLAKLETK